MLTFFRRIRKKLLGQNGTSKYLLYAIGEIALVVIGILIALQINNWNLNRLDVNKELQLVRDLDNELRENERYIQWRIEYLTGAVQARGIKLLNLTGPLPTTISSDSLSVLLRNAIYQIPYSPIIAEYEHLMGSDDHKLIRHDSLKQLLFQYKAKLELASWKQFEMRDEIIQYLQNHYSTLPILLSGEGTWFNEIKDEIDPDISFDVNLQSILSDSQFQSLIATRFEANVYTINLLKGVLGHIRQMRQFVNQHYSI